MAKKEHPFGKITSNKQTRNPSAKGVAQQSIYGGDRSKIESSKQSMRLDQNTSHGQRTFEQKIETGSEGSVNNSSQTIQQKFSFADKDYFFELTILEPSSDNQSNLSITKLKSAQVYIVRVTAHINKYLYEQNKDSQSLGIIWQYDDGIKVDSRIRLFIDEDSFNRSETAIEPICLDPIDGQEYFTGEGREDWYCDFEIKTKENYRICATRLNLFYEDSKNGIPKPATKFCLALENSGLQALPESLVCYFPANAEPPDKSAILHIFPLDQQQLNLIGWIKDSKNRPAKLKPIKRLQLPTSSYSNQLEYLEKIEQTINDDFVNANEGNLVSWFEQVLKIYADQTNIIIIDQADSPILFPWEIFKLPGNRYLGSHAVITRWTEAQYYGQPVTMSNNYIPTQGQVLASIDSQQQLPSNLCDVTSQKCSSLSELQYYLGSNSDNIPTALVYLQYSGVIHHGDEGNTLNQLPSLLPKLRKECRFDTCDGSVEKKPIFFVNAPYSGHIFWSGQKSCGLIKAILSRVGAGCIATLSFTNPSIAKWIGDNFLKFASSEKGVNPAEFLKLVRFKALEEFNKAEIRKKREAKLKLLYKFMYVYYGHPQAVVKIKPKSSNNKSQGGSR